MSEITLNTYKVYVGILKTTYTHFKIYLRNVVKQSFGAGAAPKVDCFSKNPGHSHAYNILVRYFL